ncbi:lectin C-type domain protein [Ancylostoma caninum]|uniref:Lectin C-type domain protein n=1 Tax=Ancylostoma caninum TaxID=29170 RepID=A0A368H7A4_ANCCA|nr:lectin C-type domain protein [Ancylostoma caninum]
MYKAAFDGWVFWSAKNFDDAENRCRRNGAHLVSIHNELENQFVHTLTSSGRRIESFEDFVYIGLRMNPRTGKWGWTDGSKVDYRQWAVHQPDEPRTEHCAQVPYIF